ncbi:MAG: hypothetical protein WCF88_04575 [Candidatus Acidiferrales bacterium]|jgi:hypothetical protein
MIPLREILYVLLPPDHAPDQTDTLPYNHLRMHPDALNALLALQTFTVLFLTLHDWIPLGTLNILAGVHAADSRAKLFTTTVISAAPYAFGLAASIFYFRKPYPDWLFWWLWISYALLFLGQLRAWWIPYLLRPDPARAARYQQMFGATHAFLPEQNGIRPNTLHILLHVSTAALLIVLAVLTFAHQL